MRQLLASSVQRLGKKNSDAFLREARSSKLEATERGFSLIEMIVSVGLFTIVMLVAVGALLALVDANRKARTLQSVVNNLNVALDGMVRALRMGHTYNCGGFDPITQGANPCSGGNTVMSFIARDGSIVVYEWDDIGHRIRTTKNGGPPAYLTAPQVDISDMKFYIVGTTPGAVDGKQPKVVIVIKGTASSGVVKTSTTFSIQSTAVQRILDL